MDVFLGRILQLMPVLGCNVLTRILDVIASNLKLQLTGKIKGLIAKGQSMVRGFVVFANSKALTSDRPSAENYVSNVLTMRDEFKKHCTLVLSGDNFRFTRDAEFCSPSMAAAIICGGHANGLTFWKDKNGREPKEIEATS